MDVPDASISLLRTNMWTIAWQAPALLILSGGVAYLAFTGQTSGVGALLSVRIVTVVSAIGMVTFMLWWYAKLVRFGGHHVRARGNRIEGAKGWRWVPVGYSGAVTLRIEKETPRLDVIRLCGELGDFELANKNLMPWSTEYLQQFFVFK